MEYTDLPRFVASERDALLAEIQEAFPGGSRQGGVSWSEADVIDDYGSPEERAAARARDRDTRWQDLLEDPSWDPANGGQWSFLDAIGFRYYLPAAMVLAVRQGCDSGILFHLSLPEGDLRDYTQSQWMLLNLPQRLCVKRFLQYMGIITAWRRMLRTAGSPRLGRTGARSRMRRPNKPRQPLRADHLDSRSSPPCYTRHVIEVR